MSVALQPAPPRHKKPAPPATRLIYRLHQYRPLDPEAPLSWSTLYYLPELAHTTLTEEAAHRWLREEREETGYRDALFLRREPWDACWKIYRLVYATMEEAQETTATVFQLEEQKAVYPGQSDAAFYARKFGALTPGIDLYVVRPRMVTQREWVHLKLEERGYV